jgi:RNA polymerase sigma-54 factor
MKQNLQLRISQNLALTPQLQQSIRLLQLSSLELNQELDIILQENPLLELVDGDNPDADLDDDLALPELANGADSDQIGADGESSPDGDDVDAFSNIDYQDQDYKDSPNPTPSTEEAPQEIASQQEDFSATDFDEDYEEYGSASNWDEGSRQNNGDDDDGDYSRQEALETICSTS